MAPRFETTHWSLVLAAREQAGPRARSALQELCETYWPPLYSHVRRQVKTPEEAEDLTQGFFADLIERRVFARAAPDRGRLRSFLLACLRNYLSRERERAGAAKRGARRLVAMDVQAAEQRWLAAGPEEHSPERQFERDWALALLGRVRELLREEMELAGRGDRFGALEPLLSGRRPARSYRELGSELGLSEAAVKMAVHRLRKRYAQLLRQEVAQTVASPGDVEPELRHLLAAVSREPPRYP